MSRFQSLRRGRRGRRALVATALMVAAGAVLVGPAAAVPPIGPTPTTEGTVTLTASPVTLLANGQAVTFTVHTSGGTTLVGHIVAHLCIHGSTTYGASNFGYSDASASRCVYSGDIVSGGLNGADYEQTYPSYSGSETTSGPLTFNVGTGSVTWGNALGYGPFTLQADSTHEADLVIQVNLAGDTTPTTYFIQPLTFASIPGAPTAVKGQPASASASVSWTAPANHGVSPITGYIVTPYLGTVAQTAQTFNTTATTDTITGLTNAKSYTFKVAAKNALGTGPQSAASAAVVVGAPKSPTGVSAKTGTTTAATGPIGVSYSTPANNGAAISKYIATCSSAGLPSKTGTHTGATAAPITVGGGSTGHTYTCTVRAYNSRGASPASAASPAIVIGSPAQPAKPTVARTASGTLKVTFTLLTTPQDNGSALSTPKYTATCTSSNGGATKSATGTGSPINVTGLTPGFIYTCTIKAHNARGYGLSSVASLTQTA